MGYLENAFKFISKHFMILIPLFLMQLVMMVLSAARFTDLVNELGGEEFLKNYSSIINNQSAQSLEFAAKIYGAIGYIFGISLIASVIVIPATFGMINKAYSTGSSSLADFFPELKNNLIKFIQFVVTLILFTIAYIIGMGIVVLILSAVLGSLGAIGAILIVIITLALYLLFFPLIVMVLMWYAGMVTEDCGPFEAFSKAFGAMIYRFWSVLGISLLTIFGGAILGSILYLIFTIFGSTVVAGIAYSVPIMFLSALLIVYAFEVYRGENYKNDLLAMDINDSLPPNPGDYL